jgi:transglutaminase-like putative cysteine protease
VIVTPVSIFSGAPGAASIFSVINGANAGDPSNVFKVLLQAQGSSDVEAETVEPNSLSPLLLQYPNGRLKALAAKITAGARDDDAKMDAIQRWVIEHLPYQEDKVTYNTEELWAPPTMTLGKGAGDCEDGAFLIVALALNAGVPESRLRVYGGEVKAGVGAATGGHGWAAYCRESDNEWVPVDWCYYPDTAPMSAKTPLKDDKRYVDDYFFMTLYDYVNTPGTNRVRKPDTYDNMAQVRSKMEVGWLVDTLI